MKRILALGLCLALLCPAARAAEEAKGWSRSAPGGDYVTLRVPCPQGEALDWPEQTLLAVRYADTGEPVPLTSDYQQGWLFATVPAAEAERPLEVFQGEEHRFPDCITVLKGHEYYNDPSGAKELYLRGVIQGDHAGNLNPDAALKLDGSISDDFFALRMNLTGVDYTAASGDLSQLKAAIVKRSRAYTSSQEIKTEIAAVQDEIDSLQAGLTGATDITAPRAGTYSAVCDGYESVLTPAGLGDLTPSALDSLAPGENTANVGKLIYSNTWYYAAAVAEEEAQRIAACGSVSLRLTKGVTDDIAAAVYSVGPAENGRCVVVLSCREYLAETTQLRHQTAQIVLHSYTGLRLPSVCLRQSDNGKLGVYCVQGSFPQFKPVEMVYQGDDYVLVSVPQNTEGLSTLRPGDEVIMTGVTLDGTQILKED